VTIRNSTSGDLGAQSFWSLCEFAITSKLLSYNGSNNAVICEIVKDMVFSFKTGYDLSVPQQTVFLSWQVGDVSCFVAVLRLYCFVVICLTSEINPHTCIADMGPAQINVLWFL